MDLPPNNSDYGRPEYWDKRFETEEDYDWFTSYEAYRHLILKDVKTSDSILMLGCGNSRFSEEMYKDGFRNITNTDISKVVIDKMAARHSDKPEMTWRVMDITKMDCSPESFDVVIEKGTLDALMVHEKDPWNISDTTQTMIDSVLTQVLGVLKAEGKFISITFAQPHFRRPLYARSKYGWFVELETFGNIFHFFYFRILKGQPLSESDKEKEVALLKRKEAPEAEQVFLQETDDSDFLLGMEL